MRTRIVLPMVALAFVAGTSAAAAQTAASGQAQTGAVPDWKPCPNCQSDEERNASRARGAKDAWEPRDLNGIWNHNRIQLSPGAAPLTPWGKEKYDATMSVETSPGVWLGKDPMLICDPLGFPRWFTYNYGIEFLQLPDRIIEFFEWGHTYRTIWMDGRKLPVDPDPRWMGYSVGRWEGNTLVVESNGFDERSWLSENRRDRRWGWPHSEELRTVEAYRRVDANTIEVSLTIIDPKTYTQPWVTVNAFLRSPGTELGEYFCVPSEAAEHTERVREPASGVR